MYAPKKVAVKQTNKQKRVCYDIQKNGIVPTYFGLNEVKHFDTRCYVKIH